MTVQSVPITIHSHFHVTEFVWGGFSFLARSRSLPLFLLSFSFTLWSAGTVSLLFGRFFFLFWINIIIVSFCFCFFFCLFLFVLFFCSHNWLKWVPVIASKKKKKVFTLFVSANKVASSLCVALIALFLFPLEAFLFGWYTSFKKIFTRYSRKFSSLKTTFYFKLRC